MSCSPLAAGILQDCSNPSIAGLEQNIVIVNYSDINKATCTFDTNRNKCTLFKLKSGKVGYNIEGVKQVNGVMSELVLIDLATNKFKHQLTFMVPARTAANLQAIDLITNGTNPFVIVVEKKFKGAANAEAFEIFGFEQGLYAATSTFDSKTNAGQVTITLSSLAGQEETRSGLILLETDYATTKTRFDAKFVEV